MGQINKLKHFFSIGQKIDQYLGVRDIARMVLHGIGEEEWGFLLPFLLEMRGTIFQKNHLLVTRNKEQAETLYDKIKRYNGSHRIDLFLAPESSPYSGMIPSQREMFSRFEIYHSLVLEKGPRCLITTLESLFFRGPNRGFLKKRVFSLSISDSLAPDILAQKLVEIGHVYAPVVDVPGTFCRRGEIFDVFPLGSCPIRLHYFDDVVQEMFEIDVNTQKTLRHRPCKKIFLGVSPHIFTKREFHLVLRNNLYRPGPMARRKHEKRKIIFDRLRGGETFDEFPHYLSLFMEDTECLLDFFSPRETVVHLLDPRAFDYGEEEFFGLLEREYRNYAGEEDGGNIAPSPDKFYRRKWNLNLDTFSRIEVSGDCDLGDRKKILRVEVKPLSFILGHIDKPTLNRHEYVRSLLEAIKENFKYSGRIIYLYSTEYSLQNFKEAIGFDDLDSSVKERIDFFLFPLDEGFYYPPEELLVLPESVLFYAKKRKTKRKYSQKNDFFVDQFSQLKEGDFVIHTDFGVGRYKGIQQIDTGTKGDFFIIEYLEGDRVYVPSYNAGIVQKYADSHASKVLDSLRSSKFSRTKNRAKNSAKELAFDLLKLQAQRATEEAFSFSPPDQYYREFELSFPFVETVDQEMAIESVLEDMQKMRPMDRLVCGDVGFGKTEVAMRAAFKAVLDSKQVVIVVPTTILALQHYNSFKERFKEFSTSIDFLSRFKSLKEIRQIREKIKSGDIDIIIGTHKILSSSIEFFDLGLVIVDEEHRFGVAHKEKLKLIKSSVDFLTLTATPIPRTLQMSLLGIRDLSIIKTPPPTRRAIKTYTVREDDLLLTRAIRDEIAREGQVFIICNKIKDIDNYVVKINHLVPEARVISIHGRLKEIELERRMSSFYLGEYQVLVSTTIVESGLDIPNANTMIITRADLFGLAQLHQLRGRIGRSDKRAYCYLVVPDGDTSENASRRLKALQSYVDLGAGIHLANCDLEIRGAGDILGARQAGHIDSIGLELYMDLLEEAIGEIKGRKKTIKTSVEIVTPFGALIPEDYVQDSASRLKYYKRLSNCRSDAELQEVALEMKDIFGRYPQEFLNLMKMLSIKIIVAPLGISSLKILGNNIVLKLDQKTLENFKDIRDKIIDFFLQDQDHYQLTPRGEVFCRQPSPPNLDHLLRFSANIKEKILPPH